MVKRELKFWNVPVTEELDNFLVEALAKNAHVSKADYIRDAVRVALRKEGHIP